MYSEDDLNAAVTSGKLSQQAADALRAHAAGSRATPAVDEEHFRLITGFNDIFVVIACLILLTSVGWIGGSITMIFAGVGVAVCSWGLAEFFTRKRRMALPSILLLMGFVGGVMVMVFPLGVLVFRLLHGPYADPHESTQLQALWFNFAITGPAGAVAAWVHWQRFKVPITVAAGAQALILCAFGVLTALMGTSDWWIRIASLLSGIAVFIAAMRWDASDPQRQTRNSDVAFWLHLLAAPLLVHPVFSALGVLGGSVNTLQAAGVVAVYVLIALVSLAIDRRAMMVSSLAYVLVAFGALLKNFGAIGTSFAITAFMVAAALLLLSAFWQRSRRVVLGVLPDGVRAWVAPLQQAV